MKFKSVKLKNFCSYGDNEIEFNLETNTPTLITAVNGSGKTTAFYSILWALYGVSLTKVDSVINRKTKKNCKVEVLFDIGKDAYSVIRYRHHEEQANKLYIFKNKKDISLKDASDTQQLILDIIQINYNVLKSSIIFSPAFYTSFLRSKNSDRLKIIENVFTLGFVNEYSKILKDLRKPTLDDIEKSKLDRTKTITALETIDSNIKMYKENAIKSLKLLKEEQSSKIEEKNSITNDIADASLINVEEERKKFNIQKSNNEILSKIKEEENNIKDINSLNKERLELLEEYNNISKIDIIEEKNKINEYDKIQKLNNDISLELSNISKSLQSINSLEEKKCSIKEDITKKSFEVIEISENMEKCPLCKHEVHISFNENLIEVKTNEIKVLRESISAIDKELILANKDLLENRQKELLSNIKTLPEKSKYTIQNLDNLSIKINELSVNIREREYSITTINENNKKANENIVKYRSNLVEIDNSKYTESFINDLEGNVNVLKEKLSNIERDIFAITEKVKTVYDKNYVDELEEKKNKIKKIAIKIESKLEKLYYADNHYEALTQILSNKDSGFKKFVIEKLIPVFNKHINFYISFFFDEDVSLEFDKELNPKLLVNKEEIEIESFSSGQTTRLDLSVMFALFMLVKTFFSSSVNLIVLDEILDLHLDEQGVSGVFSIIESLSKTNSVFVISHRDFYKDRLKNKIELELVDGFTRIKAN